MQIGAAALWLKAQQVCPEAKPRQLNLVASNLQLGSLPDNDPALVELRQAVEQESGIPAALTDSIVQALAGADHLGSLLKVDAAIESAITEHERTISDDSSDDDDGDFKQKKMFADGLMEQQKLRFSRKRAQFNVLTALESFLQRHTRADELGLRLYGEQLAAGVRFVRMVREGSYDLVVANPPYQGTSKMAGSKYIEAKLSTRQSGPLCGVPVTRSGTGAGRRRVVDADDAELDVYQTVLGHAAAFAGDVRVASAGRPEFRGV